MSLSEPECMSCQMVNMTNTTASEITMFLDKHPLVKGGTTSDKGKHQMPTVMMPVGCLYSNAYFSRDLTYYVLDCRGPDMPIVYLFEAASNRMITVLDANIGLKKEISRMTLPKVRLFNVTLSSGYVASVRLFLPPEISIETFKSYPLVVQV